MEVVQTERNTCNILPGRSQSTQDHSTVITNYAGMSDGYSHIEVRENVMKNLDRNGFSADSTSPDQPMLALSSTPRFSQNHRNSQQDESVVVDWAPLQLICIVSNHQMYSNNYSY